MGNHNKDRVLGGDTHDRQDKLEKDQAEVDTAITHAYVSLYGQRLERKRGLAGRLTYAICEGGPPGVVFFISGAAVVTSFGKLEVIEVIAV